MKRIFCLTCSHCDWLEIHKDVTELSRVTQKYEGYCPTCGHRMITYVEFEDQLWRFNENDGNWVLAKDQHILKGLKEMARI